MKRYSGIKKIIAWEIYDPLLDMNMPVLSILCSYANSGVSNPSFMKTIEHNIIIHNTTSISFQIKKNRCKTFSKSVPSPAV